MKVLIACEESQRVCIAFRELGHEAYSCDIQDCSGGHLEWHIKDDALKYINGRCNFVKCDGIEHTINGKWDLLIAHPPCTYLSNSGACRLYPKQGQLDQGRYQKGIEAKEFFMTFYNADCDKIVVENPIPSKIFDLPKYTQTIQPYEYGHPYSKKTCLWLKNLLPLKPTEIISDYTPYLPSGTGRKLKGASYGAKEKTGADLVKVWDSTVDKSTRPDHVMLDGQVRELEEDFEVNGRKASAPGHFGIAAEDINCRCCALIEPRSDLEQPFTKMNNETGELLEFADVKSYEEFKKKYWETVDKSAQSGIIRVGSDTVALENQRYGRNKDTLVNKTYIESGEYRRKFDNATDNPEVNKTLYDCAKKALKHRSGTVLEDMYWIDGDTGKIVTKEIDGTLQRKVEYSTSTKKIVNSYEKNKLITIHTHPSSMPPSAGDFNACFHHGYKCGYIACHDGRIFAYTAGEEINTALYNMYIEAHIKQHKSEFESQILALKEIKRNCKIEFWEVI